MNAARRDSSAWSGAFATELGVPAAGSQGQHNLLVVSDLHIGSGIEPSDPGFIKEIGAFNHAFCRFLEYYADHRVDGRPWRLVIAGDMIDFLRASLTRKSEHFDGPRSAERAAVSALDHIVSRNRRVFRDLAAFVGMGNELVVIKGNHDAEFHWDEVQARFQSLLVELYAEARIAACPERTEPASDAEIAGFLARTTFFNWFYYEHDLVYIEHGNQYDEFCSFEHVLSPVISEDKVELEDPISHQTFRVFAGLISTLDIHKVEQWKMLDYMKWIWSLGWGVVARLAYTYFASLSWMLRTQRRLARAAMKAKEEQNRRLRELTLRFKIGEDVLRKVDALRRRPAGNSVFSGMKMLYMDQLAIGALTVLLLAVTMLLPGGWSVRGGIAGGAVALAAVAALIRSRQRQVDSHPKLLDRARHLGRLLKVPFIVMGHSHEPVFTRISDQESAESTYINTGSWTREGHRGLTHLCILVGQKPAAELRRWDQTTHLPAKAEI